MTALPINHLILLRKVVPLDDPEYKLDWKYFMLQCLGCEEISFRIETHDYETTYFDEDDFLINDVTVKIYPPPLLNHKPLDEQHILPKHLHMIIPLQPQYLTVLHQD